MSDVSVSTVRIKIGDTEVDMTLDQARDLNKTLNDLFGEKPGFVPIPQPNPVPQQPIIIDRWPSSPWWSQPVITCGGTEHSQSNTLLLEARG